MDPGVALSELPGVGLADAVTGGQGRRHDARRGGLGLHRGAGAHRVAHQGDDDADRDDDRDQHGQPSHPVPLAGLGPDRVQDAAHNGEVKQRGHGRRQARRAAANITNGYVRAVPADTVRRVVAWYDQNARDLPWRHPGTSPWAVLVSEFMLQQTPVERVREPWSRWLERWPTPADLAAAPSGEAVRAWGRLGYPRRALRLHGAAVAITERFGGEVPADLDDLRSLPGVGGYTAAAVASFAFGRRAVVLDTNVRRVIGRLAVGEAHPGPAQTRAEVAVAETFLPDEPALAARWAVASMELGAVVCTARAPRCDACPVSDVCAWRRAGYPAWTGPPRRGQSVRGHRPAVPGRPAGRAPLAATSRSTSTSSWRPGPNRCSASGRWPRSSSTAWSSRRRATTPAGRCPADAPPSAGRAVGSLRPCP